MSVSAPQLDTLRRDLLRAELGGVTSVASHDTATAALPDRPSSDRNATVAWCGRQNKAGMKLQLTAARWASLISARLAC
jgi:hypothetical protein